MYLASSELASLVLTKGQFVPTVHDIAVLLQVHVGLDVGSFVLEPQTTTFWATPGVG